jgi:selenocysteine-specific elongation factor
VQVIATAGHVDHGKSTLVRALTGQDPDRLAEEQRRGLSIALGYCWCTLPDVGDVAFVDVPGHERFVSTMLAGVGPVPAVLFVVAADDPWMPQAAEHLAVLDAFAVRHGVVAVARSDLADPEPMIAETRARLRATSLADARIVAVSARTGLGLDDLRLALVEMATALPPPKPHAPVRLWVDRRFHVRGAGTVVTGTLPAGQIKVGDQLRDGRDVVRVRGIEVLGRPVDEVQGVARVALRLGGGIPDGVRRGVPLTSTGHWHWTDVVDVRVEGDVSVPERPLVHIGSAAVPARYRPLDGNVGRLRLEHPTPLHVGDRVVLRDPGSRGLCSAIALDPLPPPLGRRGAARRRAEALAASSGTPDLADELRRRRVVRISELERIGVTVDRGNVDSLAVRTGDWLLDLAQKPRLEKELLAVVEDRQRSMPLDPALPLNQAATRLGLPAPELVLAVVAPPLEVVHGRVVDTRGGLPGPLLQAIARLEQQLGETPFAAPDADQLAELGLDRAGQAAAEKAGRLLRVGDGVVLLPGADRQAAAALSDLPQPFTTSQARVRLGTSRRVVLPLLALLDARRLTRRLPDDRREVTPTQPA